MNSKVMMPAWLAYAGYGLLNLACLLGLLAALETAGVVWLALCMVSAQVTRNYTRYRANLELDDPEIYQPDRSGW